MPWREVCYMDGRTRFVAAVLAGEGGFSELCEEHGVSRKTGYKWLRRYEELGAAGLSDRSHAPRVVPWAISQAQCEAIIGLRLKHPRWGPKKLRAKLNEQVASEKWPAQSTIGELLKREGLSQPRKRRRRATPTPATNLLPALGPNDLWPIDFKGWFRTGDGERCNPLTVSDAYSRYLLCSQVVNPPSEEGCRTQLERVFRQYGLPQRIRSDNGAPFASVGVGGLSRLSIWWLKLGIRPERIAPGKPQQNGCHERMHATLKAECASPAAASLAAQQRSFDRFRAEFNHQRPHEALGQTPPVRHYQASPRSYPSKLEDPCYPDELKLRRICSNGELNWHKEKIFIGKALIGEVVGLLENEDGDLEVYFGPMVLGVIDNLSLKLKHR